MKTYIMPMRDEDRYIFDAVKSGVKNVETRAGGPKYQNINEGDIIEFRCGDDRFQKTVSRLKKFKTVSEMLKEYSVKEMAPWLTTEKELEELIMNFPGYAERIREFGLIAFQLK